jgi:hypothetical protein
MSVFFDEASLVVVPSGYKSGKIYAQKPLTTDGQLTFTRASTATRVNASGLIESVASGVPRLDYLGSTCPKLLLEPQRSNLATWSEAFENASWTGSAVVTANSTISPDGTQNADTINDNNTSYLDKRKSVTITANATYTCSFFVKKTTGSLTHYAGIGALLTGASAVVDYGIINTTTGVINRDASSNINSASYFSVSYGDYWRVSLTFTDNQSNTTCVLIVYPAISSNGTSISSNAQGSNVFWGAMLEAGAYPTSYVKTEAAAVTRVADGVSKTGISSLIGQTEGTLFVDFNETGLTPSNASPYIEIYNDADNRITIFKNTSTQYQIVIRVSGTTQVNITYAGITGRVKIAFAYALNNAVAYINGTQVGSDTSTTVPTCSSLYLGSSGTGTTQEVTNGTNQALLFKTRLSNAKLAELTTL